MKKILKIFIGFLLFGFLSFGLNLQLASADTYNIYPTNIQNVTNKAKLDAFLNKVLESRKEFTNDSNYLVFLNKINQKLDSLSSSYTSNQQIKTMILYLKSGINNITTFTKQNTDVDSFFCELFGDCNGIENPICPVYSLANPPSGCNYVFEKDSSGCDVPKLSCGTVCTKEYAPVCAQPPMPICPDGMSCIQAFPPLKTYGNKCLATSERATIQYEGECKNTTTNNSFNGGPLNGLIYIKSNLSGVHTNGDVAISNTKLDLVKTPFSGITCPTGYERVGIGLRIEENGTQNYQVFSCVKKQGNIDYSTMPKGTLMGLIYVPSNSNGVLTNGENALSNTKLDSVRLPFSGITCPVGFERVGIGMRKEENGTQNYQVFTCVKTTGPTDYNNMDQGTLMGLIYLPSNSNGVLTNGENALSNTKLNAVRFPFSGITCPVGFERVGIGMRIEENGAQNYQVFTCVKTTKPNTTSSTCSWQYHSVVGPVGTLDINPNTTSCTTSLNGRSAYEISGNKQKVATCACTGGEYPQPATNIVNIVTGNTSLLLCGDPNRNDYTSYTPSSNGIVGINIDYCIGKGGKIWNKCTSGIENLKDVSSIKNGDSMKCSELNNGPLSISGVDSGDTIAITYNIDKSLGYKQCVITAGDKEDMISIVNGTVTVGNGTTSGLGNLGTNQAFSGTRYYKKGQYLNLYCAKVENAQWPQMEKVISSVIIDRIVSSPITKLSVSQIPGNTTSTSSSCSWQYHSVVGPVGTLDINPNTTSCTTSLNGRSAYEISGNKQKVATCNCTGTDIPSTPSCSGTQPSGEGVFKRLEGFGGIQNTGWTYVENNGTYSGDNFGSTMCTWTCSVGYTRSGNTCIKSSSGFSGSETITLGNTFPTYGNSACIEQHLYSVFGGLKKASNPKGCAQLAGTNVCNTASSFRNFTSDEWVSETTVRTQASAGSFPAGNYEFFLMYGTEIRKIGSGTLRQCNTAKVLSQGDVSTFIDATRRELNNDNAAFVKISLEALKYEREGYTGIRQQIANHLGISVVDVNNFINMVVTKSAGELYVDIYQDLLAAFNSNNLGLTKTNFGITHYEKYGRSEGRYFPQK